MAVLNTLQQIAAMLPEEQRERFLLMCARFQSVPEDDEYLQILEAIGFMTLLWQEVPEQIQRILEKAQPMQANHQQLEKLVGDAVIRAVPSYEDLMRFTERMENHETALKRLLSVKPVKTQERGIQCSHWVWFVAGFFVNFLIGYILYFVN